MTVVKPANLALRFALEIAALASLGYWGFKMPEPGLLKLLFGFGLPVLAAVLWGLFVSPKAKYRLPELGRLALEILLFGSAVLALIAAGLPTPAAIFAGLVLIHLPLTFLLDQRRH